MITERGGERKGREKKERSGGEGRREVGGKMRGKRRARKGGGRGREGWHKIKGEGEEDGQEKEG